MISNCFIRSCYLWLRYGGGLIIRRSEYGPWLHFKWVTVDHFIVEFVPRKSHAKVLKAWWGFPPLWYFGRDRIVGRVAYSESYEKKAF